MNKNKIIALTLASVMVLSVSGCSSSQDNEVISNLNNLEGANISFSEEQDLSYSERQELLYKRLRSVQLIKLASLSACSDSEISSVMSFMDTVDKQVVGTIRNGSTTHAEIFNLKTDTFGVSDDMLNYMLMWFEQTPYYWQRSNVTIQGKDNTSDCIVVDVTYKTIDFEKDVLPDSKIAWGSTNRALTIETRYERTMELYSTMRDWLQELDEDPDMEIDEDDLTEYCKNLTKYAYAYCHMDDDLADALKKMKLQGITTKDIESDTLQELLTDNVFTVNTNASASVTLSDLNELSRILFDQVYDEQSNDTPSEYIYLNGNQYTTSGIESETEGTGTVTFRFILHSHYVYGIDTGIVCDQMYMYSYNLNGESSDTEEKSIDVSGYQLLSDEVYSKVKSYITCLDESNYTGLYKLLDNFESLDKSYYDWFEYSYMNHDSFKVNIESIEGTTITGTFTVSSGERPRNTNMTLPSYTDTYRFTINVIDEELKFTSVYLVDRAIQSEPTISVEDEVDTGFSYNVSLTTSDKKAIEEVICNLGAAQLKGDVNSDKYTELVALSISDSEKALLDTNVFAITGSTKAVWIQSYLQGSTGDSGYAQVQTKESVSGTNGVTTYTVRYEFIKRGSVWELLSYTVVGTSSSGTDLSTSGAMCVCTPDSVDSYTSQADTSDTDTTEDTASHDVYTKDYTSFKPSIVTHDTLEITDEDGTSLIEEDELDNTSVTADDEED